MPRLPAALLLVLPLAACTAGDRKAPARDSALPGGDTASAPLHSPEAVMASLGETVILPDYRAFAEGSAAAAAAATAFCAAPDSAGLDGLRAAWWALRSPWKQAEVMRFGPYREQPWRIGPAIDTWPGDPTVWQEILDDTAEIDVDLYGTTRKGMPPVEWLLWEGGDAALADFTAAETGARRCALLTALSDELAREAAAMVTAWDPDQQDWLAQLTAAGTVPVPEGEAPFFEDGDAAFSEYANRLIFAVEDTRLMRLSKPFGELEGTAPQPALLESRFSDRSRQDALDTLAGVRRHVLGDGGLGMVDLLPPDDRAALTAAFEQSWATAEAEVAAIPEPLAASLDDDPASLRRAIQALTALQVVLQVDMAQAWQITVRFNDNDGD